MAEVLSKGEFFDPVLVTDLISKVQGKSSLAKLSKQVPLAFNGNKEFIFSLDSDIDVVAENGKKGHGGMSIEPVIMMPIKVEYGARISDEFKNASEETRLDILKAFNDGFSKKLARGFDIMALHGLNPRTKAASDVIGNNCFDKKVTQTVAFDGKDADGAIENAVNTVEAAEGEVTGLAIDPSFRAILAKTTTDAEGKGVRLYPELRYGGNPDSINGLALDVNRTISATTQNKAYVGDFAEMFRWGYAKKVWFETIEFGDPDNSGKDLKGHNQIYLRAEAYLGWGILVPEHFAIVKQG